MDPYLELAKKSIETYLEKGQKIKPPSNLPKDLLTNQAGVFVSLHQKNNGELRGCIGTFRPVQTNIALEIISNALNAAFGDPRFPPLKKAELANLDITVDVLHPPQQIKTGYKLSDRPPDKINPKKYGLIVSSNNRCGLLLPDIPGISSAKEQLEICYQKAGLPFYASVKLEIFTVDRHHQS